MIKAELYRDRVLEPLCEATKTILKPLDVLPNDFLLVGVDKEAKRFVVKPVQMNVPVEGNTKRTLTCPDGVERVISPWLPSFVARDQFFDRIPEKKQITKDKQPTGKWILAGTDFTVLVIHHAWPKNQVVFGDDAKVLYQFILTRFLAQSASANMIARFKADGTVPKMPEDYIVHPDPDLRLSPYQEIGLLASLNQPGYALFMEQGTGKTPIKVNRVNLEGFRKRRDENKMYKVLVTCPKQVLKNWAVEFKRFSTRPGKTSILRGGPEKRNRCLSDGIMEESDCCWSACIVSTDSVPAMWDTIKLVNWDLVIHDESHGSKNPSSKRFKHFRKFGQFSHIRQISDLTGTPIANTIMDLWSQFEMMGEGLSGFMSFKNFRSYHGKYQKMELEKGGSIDKLIGIKNVPLIQERLARISYLLTSEEAGLKLPEKVYDFAEVDMTKEQVLVYKRIAAALVHEIENDLGSTRLTTDHILTKLLRLAQITSGHVTWDKVIDPISLKSSGGHTDQISSVNPKVNYVVDEIMSPERDPKGKMILWCCFVEDIRVLSAKLAELGINHVGYHRVVNDKYRVKGAAEAEEKFNLDDDCRVFLGNPASAGTGLNLLGYDRTNPDGSVLYLDREIFVSCNWSFIVRDQGEKRGHRRGSRSPSVRITDLIVSDTIDEEIRDRLRSKKKMVLEVQDIREILRKLL